MRGLLTALHCTAVLGFNAASYDFHEEIAGFAKNFTVHWKTDATDIYLALTAMSTGWLGFGIAEQTVGSMPGADMVVGSVVNGVGSIKDMFAVAKVTPSEDPRQDWTLLASEETQGKTVLEMKRKLDTGDINDRPIVLDKPMFVVVAYGASDQFFQHENRKATALHFGTGVIPDPLANIRNDPGVFSFDVRQNFQIRNVETDYIYSAASNAGLCYDFHPSCSSFVTSPGCTGAYQGTTISELCPLACAACTPSATNQGQIYVIGMEVVETPQTAQHVHHIVLKAFDGSAGGAMVDLWATAHGSTAFVLPEACSYYFGNRSAGLYSPFLQTHYDNRDRTDVGALDQSGVRLYYTRQQRGVECGMISLGDPSVQLQGTLTGLEKTQFTCGPTCTNQLPFTIQVFGSLLHMHGVGKRIYTEQFRNGVYIGQTNAVDFYDSGFQRLIAVNYTIQKGDELKTTCIHLAPTPVPWGAATSQEMCMEFVYYYPKLGGGTSQCGYPRAASPPNPAVCGQSLGTTTLQADNITSFGTGATDPRTPAPTGDTTAGAWTVIPGLWLAGMALVL